MESTAQTVHIIDPRCHFFPCTCMPQTKYVITAFYEKVFPVRTKRRIVKIHPSRTLTTIDFLASGNLPQDKSLTRIDRKNKVAIGTNSRVNSIAASNCSKNCTVALKVLTDWGTNNSLI